MINNLPALTSASQCPACRHPGPPEIAFCLYCGSHKAAATGPIRPYHLTITRLQPGGRTPLANLLDKVVPARSPRAFPELTPECLPLHLTFRLDEAIAQMMLDEFQRLGAECTLEEDRAVPLLPRRAPVYSTVRFHYFMPRLRSGSWTLLAILVLLGQLPLVILILVIHAFLQRVSRENYESEATAPPEVTPPDSAWTVGLIALFAVPVFLLPLAFLLELKPILWLTLFLVGAGALAAHARRQRARHLQTFALDPAAVRTYFSGFTAVTVTAVRQALRELVAPRLRGILVQAVQTAFASIGAVRRAVGIPRSLLAPIAAKLEHMLRHLCNALGRAQRLEEYLADHRLAELEAQEAELAATMGETEDLPARDLLRQAVRSKQQEIKQYQQIVADQTRLEAQLKVLQAGFSHMHGQILKISLLDVQYGKEESADLEQKMRDLTVEVESIDAGISELFEDSRQ